MFFGLVLPKLAKFCSVTVLIGNAAALFIGNFGLVNLIFINLSLFTFDSKYFATQLSFKQLGSFILISFLLCFTVFFPISAALSPDTILSVDTTLFIKHKAWVQAIFAFTIFALLSSIFGHFLSQLEKIGSQLKLVLRMQLDLVIASIFVVYYIFFFVKLSKDLKFSYKEMDVVAEFIEKHSEQFFLVNNAIFFEKPTNGRKELVVRCNESELSWTEQDYLVNYIPGYTNKLQLIRFTTGQRGTIKFEGWLWNLLFLVANESKSVIDGLGYSEPRWRESFPNGVSKCEVTLRQDGSEKELVVVTKEELEKVGELFEISAGGEFDGWLKKALKCAVFGLSVLFGLYFVFNLLRKGEDEETEEDLVDEINN